VKPPYPRWPWKNLHGIYLSTFQSVFSYSHSFCSFSSLPGILSFRLHAWMFFTSVFKYPISFQSSIKVNLWMPQEITSLTSEYLQLLLQHLLIFFIICLWVRDLFFSRKFSISTKALTQVANTYKVFKKNDWDKLKF
jgi:hypothetical protein